MKFSHTFVRTGKEPPAHEVAKNAQLLAQAGYIHKEMAGAYAFLPLGFMVLDNIVNIIREEMNQLGGEEMQLTALQRPDVWEATGRWPDDELEVWFKSQLLAGGEVGLAATHEEPLTALMREYIHSYRDLPAYPYQFQTKFRNELRAKSGIMRGREFLMKDLYSFSASWRQHEEFYEKAKQAYARVFDRLGIGGDTFYTYADGGSFSQFSHEYQTLTEAGEDTIYLSREGGFAINQEVYTDEVLGELGVTAGDMEEVTAAEVANIFPLGTKFSDSLDLTFTDQDGAEQPVIMGSYGIGPGRVMGVLVEKFSDEKGIVWPQAVAPAQVHLLNLKGGEAQADSVYAHLQENGIRVLYDDRDESPGSKLADADLMGLPTRLVCSQKTAESEQVEVTHRASGETQMLPVAQLSKKFE
jgi:prolyl-tRNA synthetase